MILWKLFIHSWQARRRAWKNRVAVRPSSTKSHALPCSGSLCRRAMEKRREGTKEGKANILFSNLEVIMTRPVSHYCEQGRPSPAAWGAVRVLLRELGYGPSFLLHVKTVSDESRRLVMVRLPCLPTRR